MWSKFAQRQPPPPPPPTAQQNDAPSAPPPPSNPSPSLPSHQSDDIEDDGAWGYDDQFLEEEQFDDVNVDDEIIVVGNRNNIGVKHYDADAGGITVTKTTNTEAEDSSRIVLNNQVIATTIPTAQVVDECAVGWDDDDDGMFLNDSISQMEVTTTATTPASVPDKPESEPKLIVEVEEKSTSSLGQAAESFGAALLASIDNEDNDNYDRPSHGVGTSTRGVVGGFGGGFVMKGLSRFLEAATAPSPHQKEVEEDQELNDVVDDDLSVINEDGWGDDDALDFKEDANIHEQELPMVQGATISSVDADESQMVDTTEDGWKDDIDISFNSPQHQQLQPRDNDVDSVILKQDVGDSSDISKSIKDFVAITEKALDSKFTRGMWDTPPRNDLRMGAGVSSSLGSTDMKTTINTFASSIAEAETDVASKSLIDFVDNLDAELNEFTHDEATAIIDATGPIGISSNFVSSKDDSPEPLLPQQGASLSLPRQESWYLNAMEVGKGGVVYGDETVELQLSQNLQNLEGRIIPDTSSSDSTSIQRPPVGLPLSEFPSSVDSLASSKAASDHGDDNRPSESFRKSEIQCDCLELIMPLPNGNENGESDEPGYGRKKLPDGTVVLVNYEKLLQNEATKRILLQRTVETYEHTIESLQSRHQASMKTAHEQEIQLASSHVEISQLKELVLRLQDEKDNMVNEIQLFEAELAAVANDKEYLQQEVETIQQDLKVKEDLFARNIVQQKHLENSLQEKDAERASLIDQVAALQSSLIEVQAEHDNLEKSIRSAVNPSHSKSAEEIETLEQELLEKGYEIERLNDQINSMMIDQGGNTVLHEEHYNLREEHERLQSDFSALQLEMLETKPRLSMLQDENETMRSMNREYNAQLSELKATAELTDYDFGEVDKLAAEVASLTYELGVKATECEESASALQTLQAKLVDSEARVGEYDGRCNVLGENLRIESESHSRQVADLQTTISSLEIQTTDLKRSLDEKLSTIQTLESQIHSLNGQVTDSASLHEELSNLKKSLDEKSAECSESSFALQVLQSKFDDAEARLAAYAVTPNEGDHCSELEQSLRAENCVLCKQMEDMRCACSLLESEKARLEATLHENANVIQRLEAQIQNAQMTTSTKLQDDLSHMRESFDEKVHECETMTSYCEQLKLELLNSRSEQDVIIATSEKNADDAREQILKLQSQIADLLKDQNATMMNVEDQLTNTIHLNSKLQAQCDEYRMKLEDAEKECAYISQTLSDTVARHSEQMSTVEEKLSTALQNALTVKQQILTEEAAKSALLQKSIDLMKEEEASMARRYHELLENYRSLMDEKAEITQALESRATATEQHTSLLQQECAQLRINLDFSQKSSVDAAQSISYLKEQLQYLKESNADLEGKLFEASFEPSESDLTEVNASLRHEKDELKAETMVLEKRINMLTSQLTSISAQNNILTVEKEALLSRVQTLEEELRAENLGDLRDEITSLQTERQQLDLDNEELLVQLGLMQQDKVKTQAECEVEIDVLREEVAALQNQCSRLQNDLDESRRNSLLLRHESEDNDSLHQTISQITRENESLKDRINELSGKTDSANQEIKKLRQELALQTLKVSDKEEETKSRQKGMQYTLDQKDLKLTTENRSMLELSSKSGIDLHSVGDNSEEEKYYEGGDDDVSLQNLLAETVLDSDDYLRSQVVILAQALERSELQRADAIERIFTERKSNEATLRQLGESMKRFYSTMK